MAAEMHVRAGITLCGDMTWRLGRAPWRSVKRPPNNTMQRTALHAAADELKKLTFAMAEAFGLDRRIDAYQGKRSIQFYRWDLDCLVDVLSVAVKEAEEAPGGPAPGYGILKGLHDRLHGLREKAYEELEKRQS
jgi:endonuclease/exonuclease/phosphatase family metal-dependent hydrolase